MDRPALTTHGSKREVRFSRHGRTKARPKEKALSCAPRQGRRSIASALAWLSLARLLASRASLRFTKWGP